MELSDIIQIILLSAIIFFFLGWTLKSRVQRGFKVFQNYFLKPRYLKSAGFLSENHFSEKAKKE